MSPSEILRQEYGNRLIDVQELSDIPTETYGVYVLLIDEKPIVLGHGKRNRAKVILDNLDKFTSGHIKAFFVRCYHLFSDGEFSRFFLPCDSKADALFTEGALHHKIGGNNREIPDDIYTSLMEKFPEGSLSEMIVKIALRSSFDGISDLRKWRREGIIDDSLWSEIANHLKLKDPIKPKKMA